MVIECSCGFSCGTEAAFQKHVERFNAADQHVRVQKKKVQKTQQPQQPTISIEEVDVEKVGVEVNNLYIGPLRGFLARQYQERKSPVYSDTLKDTATDGSSGSRGMLVSRPHAASLGRSCSIGGLGFAAGAIDVARAPKLAATHSAPLIRRPSLPLPLSGGATGSSTQGFGARLVSSSRGDVPASAPPTQAPTALGSLLTPPPPHQRERSSAPAWVQASCISPPPSSQQSTKAAPIASNGGKPFRILVVRHARSENKDRGNLDAKSDPVLSPVGVKQADALCRRLVWDLKGGPDSNECNGATSVLVVSSPAKLCLLTVALAVRGLGLQHESCICHGGAYEFRACGHEHRGSSSAEIERAFPGWRHVGFNVDGYWDYSGSSQRETESEVRDRAARFVSWLHDEAIPTLCAQPSGPAGHTIVLVFHQSFADLICQLLVEGTDKNWEYTSIQYRLQEAGITELVQENSKWRVVSRNMTDHLAKLATTGTQLSAALSYLNSGARCNIGRGLGQQQDGPPRNRPAYCTHSPRWRLLDRRGCWRGSQWKAPEHGAAADPGPSQNDVGLSAAEYTRAGTSVPCFRNS